jgi:hypothetical protein
MTLDSSKRSFAFAECRKGAHYAECRGGVLHFKLWLQAESATGHSLVYWSTTSVTMKISSMTSDQQNVITELQRTGPFSSHSSMDTVIQMQKQVQKLVLKSTVLRPSLICPSVCLSSLLIRLIEENKVDFGLTIQP